MSSGSSDNEDQFDFDDNESGSDDYEAEKPKKAAAKPKAALKAAAKPKAVAKPKAAATTAVKKAPAAKKKAVLEERNVATSDDMVVDEGDDVAMEMAGPPVAAKAAKKKTASETYVKLSQLEHVLKRPDTYIGSVEPITQPMWVFDEKAAAMAYRSITFVPGLYKIVDEILVNAADNKVRDDKMKSLKVTINREDKTISVYNDGQGIPIEMHTTEGIWIPELIFGQLLTSSNYDDDEAKVTGGRNGYGAKLANIYSTEFIVETASSKKGGKLYRQTFSNNMGTKGKPKITDQTKEKKEDWTRITFTPDLERFNMTEFDDDTVALLQKRVYDMAGTLKGVSVHLNGKKIAISGTKEGNFEAYVKMYTSGLNEVTATGAKKAGGPNMDLLAGVGLVGAVVEKVVVHGKFGDRWEVAFAVSDHGFQQVSFCNAIATTKGGTHVDYITKQIVASIIEQVNKKNKKAATVKDHVVRNHISVFVNCLIANPAFDSQTKENMTLGVKKFGSVCKLPEDFLKRVAKSGIIDNVLHWASYKQDQLLKKTDGHKRARITGLVKLEDANNAGTKKGNECTLILTEGDSAKALAVCGISVVGRDNFGVFPLRGKLLNVREATGKALLENVEIKAIKEILGLQQGKVYTSTASLRYGSLMIMADQDHDGSHIKGLIINFLDFWFPSLLALPDFLLEFITPIVKVTNKRSKKTESFFTIPEYETWKDEVPNMKGFDIKYFKGLGTSTAADAKVYFSNMLKHRLPFRPSTQEDRELIDMAFNKKKADNRKEWLRGFVPGTFIDHSVVPVPLCDFINKELILFSMADNIRSIPSMIDGFKPGQRKVIFACFKRNLRDDIKVAQLGGYISEHSAYHHGETSLNGTIVGLAQQFVGSNNINFLKPEGQFGTRSQGGKDAASPRYIFTNLCPWTRNIFHPADDNVLDYLNDDGQDIEPTWYMPVLPMVLVNGSDGIGTGWSSTVPNYNPSDIVANLKRKMNDEELVPMTPWYRGFKGTIEKAEKDSYKCAGLIERIDDNTLEITELPIRLWTQSYKETLEGWVVSTEKQPALVKDYKEYHTDTTVHFIVTLTDKGKEAIERDGLEKAFKMTSKLNTSNMVCFDPAGKIKKYTAPEEILNDFYDLRLDYYHKRKAFLVAELSLAHERLSNQARFIKMIISKELIISNLKKAVIVADLRAKSFRPFPKTGKAAPAAGVDEEEDDGADSDYDYLLGMALYSLTAEKVAKLLAERDHKEDEVNTLLKLSAQDLWVRDLDVFSDKWTALLEADLIAKNKSLKAAKNKGKAFKSKKQYSDSEDDFEVKPKKKAAAPKPKVKAALPSDSEAEDKPAVIVKAKAAPKPKAALPPSDFSDGDDSKPVKAAVKPKAAPKAKAKVALPLSDSEDEESKVVVKKAAAPKVTKKRAVSSDDDGFSIAASSPAKAKAKPAAKKAKKELSDLDLSDDDDDDIYTRPTKPAAKAKAAPKPKVVKKAAAAESDSDAPVVKKKAAPKKKAAATSDDDVPVKKAPVKKAVKKAAVASEDEDDIYDQPLEAPKPRAARKATVAKKSYAIEVDTEDEDAAVEEASGSDFDMSDD